MCDIINTAQKALGHNTQINRSHHSTLHVLTSVAMVPDMTSRHRKRRRISHRPFPASAEEEQNVPRGGEVLGEGDGRHGHDEGGVAAGTQRQGDG